MQYRVAVWLVPYLVLGLLLAACGQTSSSSPSGQTSPGDQFDQQFIADMLVHHEGAIKDSQAVLPQLTRPEVKQLATQIIAAQTAEITQLRTWHTAWFPNQPMLTPQPMNHMAHATPVPTGNADLDFMAAMIPHHEDAVKMARAALTASQRPEIKQLAQQIIDSQTAEITQMKTWMK